MRNVLFGCIRGVWSLYETRCKIGRTGAKVHEMKSRWNFSQQTHPTTQLDPKLTFWCVSNYLGAFGAILLPYETRCKTGRTCAKVRETKSHRNFSQRMHPITALDPKLTVWCVLYYFGVFGTVWSPHDTRCKIGRTGAKVHAMKSLWNFSQQTHPIHP